MKPRNSLVLPLFLASALWACSPGADAGNPPSVDADPPTLILNITSGGEENPHAVTMALQLAGHALDEGRTTVLFFNVRGVKTPTVQFPDSVAFRDRPIKELLLGLMDRGAEVHVCPHCMAALEVNAEDLLPGARVTDSGVLFGHMKTNTVVFTY